MKNIKELTEYCLGCINKPCQKACPLHNDIPEFIRLAKEEKFEEAYKVLCKTTVLPSVCGRICPHLKQCEGRCTRKYKGSPVDIGTIEYQIGDMAIEKNFRMPKTKKLKNKKVALIGGGPASLSCAAFLRYEGIDVTIYEKHDYLGGLLSHGIPDFRLPRDVLKKSIDRIISLGIKVEYNKELGKNLSIDELLENYDAIFLGIGANISNTPHIPNIKLEGVLGANNILETKEFPNFEGKKVIVNGGGNVALDIARTLKRQKAKVSICYRKEREKMKAEIKEIEAAEDEKINIITNTNIVAVNGKSHVENVECMKTKTVDDKILNIEDSNFYIECDYLINAIGSLADTKLLRKLKLKTTKYKKLNIDENYQTNNPKIFAAGDIAGIRATVAWASSSGINAAKSILKYLEKKD